MGYAFRNGTIKQMFESLDGKRSSLKSRVKEYAHYTIPRLYSSTDYHKDTSQEERAHSAGSIGARAVNHLANKMVSVLFPHGGAFFNFSLTEEGYEIAMDSLGLGKADIDFFLSQIERDCRKRLGMAQHRATAVEAMKHLIVTGNALIKYDDETSSVYNFKDYVVKRDLTGKVILAIIREEIHPDAVPEKYKRELEKVGKGSHFKNKEPLGLFTEIRKEFTSEKNYVWKIKQTIEDVNVEIGINPQYQKDDLPWIFLTWSLSRGDDYGSGIVEDYAHTFFAHELISSSQMNAIAIMSNIKIFIERGSMSEQEQDMFTNSPPGALHEVGAEGSIWTMNFANLDLSIMSARIDEFEQELAQAFLLTSAAIRDAERVTAEEVRLQANELDTSYGGTYSILADTWQNKLARLIISEEGYADLLKETGVDINIVTGLESMSNFSELENVYQMLTDMAGISQMSPELLARIKLSDLCTYMATLRGLDPTKFLKTEEEIQEEMMAMQQQQQEAMLAEKTADAVLQEG